MHVILAIFRVAAIAFMEETLILQVYVANVLAIQCLAEWIWLQRWNLFSAWPMCIVS